TVGVAMETLCSPFSMDIPHAFIYYDPQQLKTFYSGPYMKTIQSFAETFHYHLRLDDIDGLPKKAELQHLIASGLYNVSLHGVLIRPTAEEPLANMTQYSYPLEVMQNCVMVPLPPELPKWQYMVWPLGRYVWTTLVVGIFYVAFLLRYVHWRETITRSYTRNLLHAMAILIYSPNMNMQVRLNQASLRVLVFYTLLYVQGFIISNYHISHMTSFDMKPVFVKRVNTWSDLIDSKMRIIIPDTLLEELRFLPVDYQRLLANPSRSYAYVVTQDAWDFFNRQQQVLIQPYFHKSEVCFGGLYNAFPMQKNASFADQLNRFILYAKQAGLWNFWVDMAFLYAVRANFAQVFLDTYPVEPLNFEFFTTAWIVIVVGMPVCCLVHGLEHLWYRWRSSR
ncbi:hypothetical protein KR222_004509, partial [Zaprionus bogoriensis]